VPRRILCGVVVKDVSDKTVAVEVERRFSHPLLKKTIRKCSRLQVHDEHNSYRVGDFVSIEECRPVSKLKKWNVIMRLRSEPSKRFSKSKGGRA